MRIRRTFRLRSGYSPGNVLGCTTRHITELPNVSFNKYLKSEQSSSAAKLVGAQQRPKAERGAEACGTRRQERRDRRDPRLLADVSAVRKRFAVSAVLPSRVAPRSRLARSEEEPLQPWTAGLLDSWSGRAARGQNAIASGRYYCEIQR